MNSFKEIVNQLYDLCFLEKERSICLNIHDIISYKLESDLSKTMVKVCYHKSDEFHLYFNIDLLSSNGYNLIDFDDKFSSVKMKVDFHNSTDELIEKIKNDLNNSDIVSYRLSELLNVKFSSNVFSKIYATSSRVYHVFDNLCFDLFITKDYTLNDFYVFLRRI